MLLAARLEARVTEHSAATSEVTGAGQPVQSERGRDSCGEYEAAAEYEPMQEA